MKNIYKNRRLPRGYIINYEITDNLIEVHYADNHVEHYPYTINEINIVEDRMKEQILDAKDIIEEYKKNNKIDYFWQVYNAWFTYYCGSRFIGADNKTTKTIQGCCCASFIAVFVLRQKLLDDRKAIFKEYDKYKYFIDNEQVINYENNILNESLNNSNKFDMNNMYRLGINDIDNMTLKELKEIVELITSSYGDKVLELKK